MSYELEKQNTVEAYQKIAGDFHQRNAISIYDKEFDMFESLLGDKKKILEVGCGTGRDAEPLVKRGFEYTGIDASDAMLKIAKQRLPQSEFRVMDFYKLDFPDESFDGFWAAASYLHVPKSELVQTLTEAGRVLKPEGIGFISVKEKKQIDEGVIDEAKAGGIKRYFSFFTEEEFYKYLKQASFKTLKVERQTEVDGTVWLCFFVQK